MKLTRNLLSLTSANLAHYSGTRGFPPGGLGPTTKGASVRAAGAARGRSGLALPCTLNQVDTASSGRPGAATPVGPPSETAEVGEVGAAPRGSVNSLVRCAVPSDATPAWRRD